MNALILVDIQYDFCTGGALAVPDAEAILPTVLSEAKVGYDVIVATQDFHPAGHQSFARVHSSKRPGDFISLHGRPQVLWPDHCVQGTRGSELHEALSEIKLDAVFQKGTDPEIDSYSGFFDNGREDQRGPATGLDAWLKERGVTDVTVVGLATDYCVKATAVDANALGYRTTVLTAGVRGVNLQPGDSEASLTAMASAGILVR
jgi:nicotinamidase/pyrazinamidase